MENGDTLFDDRFVISDISRDKKFTKVCRIKAE
jgi:hypothetical protein